MATATPTLELVDAELVRPGTGLVLGRSRLGAGRLGATTTPAWSSVLGTATALTIRRAVRVDGPNRTAEAGSGTLVLRGVEPATDPDLRPNVPIRVTHRTAGVLFTGVTGPVSVEYADDGTPTTRLALTDGVAAVANTRRYGARTVLGWESWPDRARRLLASCPLPFAPLPALPALVAGTSWDGDLAGLATTNSEAARFTPAGVVGGTTGGRWISPPVGLAVPWTLTLDGLTPGHVHELELWADELPQGLGFSVDGGPRTVAWDLALALSPTRYRFRLEFLATATTATLTVHGAGASDLDTMGPRIRARTTRRRPAEVCADLVSEWSLAEHLDVVATTARAWWHVDAAGVVRFTAPDPAAPAVAHFSDDPATPGRLTYVRPTLSYATDTVVNALEVTTVGTAPDPETGADVVAETRHPAVVDVTSAATWGRYAAEATTCLLPVRAPAWATAVLAGGASPALAISSLRVNAAGQDAAVAALDLLARLAVTCRGTTHAVRVVGLAHDLTPDRWITTVDLTPLEA